MNRQQFQYGLKSLVTTISVTDLACDTSNGGRPSVVIRTDTDGALTLGEGEHESGAYCEYDQGQLARDARETLAESLKISVDELYDLEEAGDLGLPHQKRLQEIENEYLTNLVTVWLEDGDAWKDFQAWEARQPPLLA
jgi:hypothetical protein